MPSHLPVGVTCQWPASSPSSRPNTDGLSNRGKASQSTEPLRVTSALECRSERRAWSAMGVLDMGAPFVVSAGAVVPAVAALQDASGWAAALLTFSPGRWPNR